MSRTSKTPENPLDRAIAAVRDEPLPAGALQEAASRVRQRLARAAAEADEARPIRGCADYQALLPAFVAGELPEARAWLVEEHTRGCLACRKALIAERTGVAPATPAVAPAPQAGLRIGWRRALPLAAVLALALVSLGLLLLGGVSLGPVTAEIQTVDGALLRVVDGSPAAAVAMAGERVQDGERLRTAKGSGAVLRLADGSRIEMSERAELAFDRGWRGTTIHLDRGHIIVQAAEQRHGKLYVATEDCLVSVVGTVFSVSHGLKGSRVSVLEGEVRVAQGSTTDVLAPGEQVTTDPTLARVPLEQEIAWSRDHEHYRALLGELAALGREIHARVERPGLRRAGRLLELVPADTTVYLAAPNLSNAVDQTYKVLLERVEASPVLGEWWREAVVDQGLAPHLEALITRVRDLGSFLGDEVILAVPAAAMGGPGSERAAPVVLAEVTGGGFATYLEQEIDRLHEEVGHPMLILVDDPAAAPAGEGLLVWTGAGVLVATPSPTLLAETVALARAGEASGFAGSAFYGRIEEAYAGGVQWLLGLDLERLIARSGQDSTRRTGLEAMRHLLLERHAQGEVAQTSALVTFDGPRQGLASWLAAPAPMGSLDFVSAEAMVAGAVVFKDPVEMLGDLVPLVGPDDFRAELAEVEAELGVDLEGDIAASLGGEIAFAIDGPLLPKPSWKLVTEVYDADRLQAALETLARRAADRTLVNDENLLFELTSEAAGGQLYHTLRIRGGEGPGLEAHYLYTDGYLVAAPSRALLDRALQVRASGAGLVTSERFRELLPANGESDFSALVFQDLSVVGEALKGLGGPSADTSQVSEMAALFQMLGEAPVVLGFAYGREDRIQVAVSGPSGPLGLGMLSALPALSHLHDLVGVHGGGR